MTWKKYARRKYPILAQLRQRREELNITRKVLAHRIGYHLLTLGRWERGETMPCLAALLAWCEALEVELGIRSYKDFC